MIKKKLTGKHLLFACVAMPMSSSLSFTIASADICVSILDDTGVLCYQAPSGYGHKIELDNGGLTTGSINSWLRDLDRRYDDRLTPMNISESELDCRIEQAIEEERDKMAREIADEIKSKSDWRDYEYGTVIYRGPNGLRRGGLDKAKSKNGSVALTVGVRAGESIVGFVHSHPTGSYSVPSPQDWITAYQEVRASGSDRENFSHYILDYRSGELYEFDMNDQGDQHATGRADGDVEQANDAKGTCNG